MTDMKKCKSCNGVFDKDQPGGYYHACPKGTVDPRNENIDDSPSEYQKSGDKVVFSGKIKSEGKGVTKIE